MTGSLATSHGAFLSFYAPEVGLDDRLKNAFNDELQVNLPNKVFGIVESFSCVVTLLDIQY